MRCVQEREAPQTDPSVSLLEPYEKKEVSHNKGGQGKESWGMPSGLLRAKIQKKKKKKKRAIDRLFCFWSGGGKPQGPASGIEGKKRGISWKVSQEGFA